MAATDMLTRLVENDYAQEQLGDAVRNLQSAYARATSRKAAKAAEDKKLYKRLRRGMSSLTEGVSALSRDRRKPKRSKGKLLVLAAAVAVAGGAAAVLARRGSDQPPQPAQPPHAA